MAFDIRNFVIDRPVMGAFTRLGRNIWMLSDIQDATLNMTQESQDKTDAIGNVIAQFDRAKTATFSAASGFFELDLLAEQVGSERKVASADNKIVARFMGTVAIEDGKNTVTLEHTPLNPIVEINVLEKGQQLGKAYAAAESASATAFSQDGAVITLPTSVTSGEIFLIYDYETDEAVEIVNEAGKYTMPGEFTLKVLGIDKCNPEIQILGYLIFGNAKLSGNTDVTFNTDMTHGFEISANTDYCEGGRLWRLVIPGI